MIKNTVAAVIASVALLGAAAPAFAATYETVSSDEQSYDFDTALQQLQGNGVNASSVEIWGDVVRAYVTLEDGTQAMQFFDKDTLVPVSL